jgi:hypothetical protein
VSRILQFTHLFAGPRQIVATVYADLDAATERETGIRLTCQEWPLSPELFEEFKLWQCAVLCDVAAQTGCELRFGFQVPGYGQTRDLALLSRRGAAARKDRGGVMKTQPRRRKGAK